MKVLLLVVSVCLPVVLTRSGRYARLQADPLSTTRCDLMCFEVARDNKPQCRAQCRSQQQKPGTCPTSDSPLWAAACVEACNSDSQCDGTQRCCRQECGSKCSEPVDLQTLPGLPALPAMEEVKERRKSFLIRWSDGVGDAARAVPGRVLYLLEEQHHLGPKYEEARLGEWTLLMRTNKTKVSLRNTLKPGRWYRFRVAAVSASGTRGFSKPSDPFTPRRGPRAPPPPKRLRVRLLKFDNGTATVRLDWKEPRSDLPVMRYKVFWSRRVKGLGGELDSVLVNHQTVSKDQTHLEIKDLQPDSMYFLQVQTISQFGLGKLRSDKAAIFYNTTTTNDQPPETLQRRDNKKERKIKGLKVNRVLWLKNKVRARISWEDVRKADVPRRYYVHWKTVQCEDNKKENKDLTATTEETMFEIYELDYKCSYKVHVNRSRKPKKPDSEIIVTVPSCEYFRQKANMSTASGVMINCPS